MVSSFSPRIYAIQLAYLRTTIDADENEWHRHLSRCAAMGFDHVLLPSVAPLADAAQVRQLVDRCASHNLRVLLDITIDQLQANDALVQEYPAGFSRHVVGDPGLLPDPRSDTDLDPGTACTDASTRFARCDVPAIRAGLQMHWRQRLQSWVDAGVVGFRCGGAASVSPAFWQGLIATIKQRQPATCFIVWSCGYTPAQIAALHGCGFDASFSSAPWWNFKETWFVEEHARLRRLAPPLAFAAILGYQEAEFSDHETQQKKILRHRLMLRSLHFAAAIGNGMLVPMGFEFGLSRQLKLAGTQRTTTLDFEALRAASGIDLTQEIAQANQFSAVYGKALHNAPLRVLSSPNTDVAILHRGGTGVSDIPAQDGGIFIVVNADLYRPQVLSGALWQQAVGGYVAIEIVNQRLLSEDDNAPADHLALHGSEDDAVVLPAGAVRLYTAAIASPVITAIAPSQQIGEAVMRSPRIAIEDIRPSVDGGRFAPKRILGETVEIDATILIDGHDRIAAALLFRAADQPAWQHLRMQPLGNDRWRARLPLTRMGRHLFAIEAWYDSFSTFREHLEKKVNAGVAGQEVALELAEGALLVRKALEAALLKKGGTADDQDADFDTTVAELKLLDAGLTAATIRYPDRSSGEQRPDSATQSQTLTLLSPHTAMLMAQVDTRPFSVRSAVLPIEAERRAAQYANWYELFPRSQSGDPLRHGTFADVIARLPAIRNMGFDTLYFPPIHPIGRKHRKGRNNKQTSAADDPGSPYAIGSEEGGHDALHPALGTFDDFRQLLRAVADHGMELALDFAIQCSPDHPWLRRHPDWFDWRVDGSIRYAENPPKKYEDIVNVDFYAEGAMPGLWLALRDVVLFWVRHGVRLFRVDNPHTKPLPFWEWMIADIRGRHPDTVFLAEAFTRPSMMYRLGKIGFSQSYTYFTWRHDKREFVDYLTELTAPPVSDYFRPHFFVNTPDINPHFLQNSGRPGFLIRAALATTLSGLWGMYNGFELCEARAVSGKEEYLDSEKYEIRAWDWQRPGNIIDEITLLNRIRAANPALQTHLGVQFHQADDANILYFSKSTPAIGKFNRPDRFGDNVILVAINLDPFSAHTATIEVPVWRFGLADDAEILVDDLVHERHFSWHGKHQTITLDPAGLPFAIWRIAPKNLPRLAGA